MRKKLHVWYYVHFSEIVDLRIMLFLHLLYLALQFFNIGVPF